MRTKLRDLNDDILWQVFYFLPAKGQDRLYDADEWMAQTLKIYWSQVRHIIALSVYVKVDRYFQGKMLQTLVLTDGQTFNLYTWLKRCPNIIQLTVKDLSPELFETIPNIQCLTVKKGHFILEDVFRLKRLTHLTCERLERNISVEMPHIKSLDVNTLHHQILQLVPNLTHISFRIDNEVYLSGYMLNPVAGKLQFLELNSYVGPRNFMAGGNVPYEFPELRELVVPHVADMSDEPSRVYMEWLCAIIQRNNAKKFTARNLIENENLIHILKSVDDVYLEVDLMDYFIGDLPLLKQLKNLTVIVEEVYRSQVEKLSSEVVIEHLANIKTLELRYPSATEYKTFQSIYESSVKFIEKLTSLKTVPQLLIKMMGRSDALYRKLSETVRSLKATHPERFSRVRVLK